MPGAWPADRDCEPQEGFHHCPGETAIALTAPRILMGSPGAFVAVEIGVTLRSPLATQTVLPSGVMARK